MPGCALAISGEAQDVECVVSKSNGVAMGFGDPVSKVLIAVARVMVKAHKANGSIKRVLENVMVDPRLVADMAIREGNVGSETWTSNALEAGGAASRVRRYFAHEATRAGCLSAPHVDRCASWSSVQQLGPYGGLPREQVRLELT